MKTNKKAFTLVELIVVITILAILGTIAFISFQNYTQSARDGTRIADINNIKKNLEIFITEKWFYPLPDNPTPITYNGWIARTQWTVWDNVITNLRNLSKKPTDPLSNNEYTYSITNAKTEYQLAYVTEWWLSYNTLLTNQANAATLKIGTAKVTGTYNEKILKVSTWSIDYILALPSIINADLATTNLQNIITNKELVYNNYQNLPDSYKNLWYTMTGWFDFAPTWNNIVVYSWSLATLSSSGTIQQQFITKLQSIYNWTILQSEPGIKEILFATTPEQQQTLVWNYITNHVWWITGVISTIATPPLSPPAVIPAWWMLVDTNCNILDRVIWTQTWAWCNSTLGTWIDYNSWTCGNYTWGIVPNTSCYGYTTKELSYINDNGITAKWFDVIWWKIYLWANVGSACMNGRHVPSLDELNVLVNYLTTNKWDTNIGYLRDNTANETNNFFEALKMPLSWYSSGWSPWARWTWLQIWTSTPFQTLYAWNKYMYYNRSYIAGNAFSRTEWYVVRCLKN